MAVFYDVILSIGANQWFYSSRYTGRSPELFIYCLGSKYPKNMQLKSEHTVTGTNLPEEFRPWNELQPMILFKLMYCLCDVMWYRCSENCLLCTHHIIYRIRVSEAFFEIKVSIFLDTFILRLLFLMIKIHDFRGDITDISFKKASLIRVLHSKFLCFWKQDLWLHFTLTDLALL